MGFVRWLFIILLALLAASSIGILLRTVYELARSKRFDAKVVALEAPRAWSYKNASYNLVVEFECGGKTVHIRTENGYELSLEKNKERIEAERERWVGQHVSIRYYPNCASVFRKKNEIAYVDCMVWKDLLMYVCGVAVGVGALAYIFI